MGSVGWFWSATTLNRVNQGLFIYIYIIYILYYISLTSKKEVVYFGLGEQHFPTGTLPIQTSVCCVGKHSASTFPKLWLVPFPQVGVKHKTDNTMKHKPLVLLNVVRVPLVIGISNTEITSVLVLVIGLVNINIYQHKHHMAKQLLILAMKHEPFESAYHHPIAPQMVYRWLTVNEKHIFPLTKPIPSSKLIKQWNLPIFNREYIFKRPMFHCHVCLPECNVWITWTITLNQQRCMLVCAVGNHYSLLQKIKVPMTCKSGYVHLETSMYKYNCIF